MRPRQTHVADPSIRQLSRLSEPESPGPCGHGHTDCSLLPGPAQGPWRARAPFSPGTPKPGHVPPAASPLTEAGVPLHLKGGPQYRCRAPLCAPVEPSGEVGVSPSGEETKVWTPLAAHSPHHPPGPLPDSPHLRPLSHGSCLFTPREPHSQVHEQRGELCLVQDSTRSLSTVPDMQKVPLRSPRTRRTKESRRVVGSQHASSQLVSPVAILISTYLDEVHFQFLNLHPVWGDHFNSFLGDVSYIWFFTFKNYDKNGFEFT